MEIPLRVSPGKLLLWVLFGAPGMHKGYGTIFSATLSVLSLRFCTEILRRA